MRKKLYYLALLTALTICSAQAMHLTSPSVHNGRRMALRQVYNGFGYKGDNQSPELFWMGAPPATKSFAITIFDPDAPRAGGWWHWLVTDIPNSVSHLPEGISASHGLPTGAVQIRNDFGTEDYGGPCPPAGKPHHYVITLYALKVVALKLAPGTSADGAKAAIESAAIAKVTLTGIYSY